MRRPFYISFLLLLPLSVLLTVSKLQAQSGSPSNAEFHLDIHFADTFSDGSLATLLGRAIGYDPMASDNASAYDDSTFGEVSDYPGGMFNGNDFWFTRPDGSGTTVDIRHKPITASFAINYSMGVSFDNYPGSIYWDPSQIPSIIKGIWIRPYEATTPLVDMKKDSILTFPNPTQAGIWGSSNLVVTIFYNMEPQYISNAVVSTRPSNGARIILNASVYPNPMVANGALDVTLAEPATLSIVGYDVAGREVLRLAQGMSMGESTLDLSSQLANVRGAIMLRIAAQSGPSEETKTVMLVRE